MGATRVLHVIDRLDYGNGVCMVVMNYMRQLDPEKWVFDIVVQHPPKDKALYDEVIARGGQIFTIGKPGLWDLGTFLRQWDQLFAQYPYPIVHGHLPVTAVFYLGTARKNKVPVRIIHSHGTRGGIGFLKGIRNTLVTRPIPLYATHFIACSLPAGQYLFGNHIAHHRMLLLPNAIDCDRFHFDAVARQQIRTLHHAKDALVIGHVARLSPEKNQGFLLDVFHTVCQTQNAFLWVMGDGPERSALESKAKDLGISERVLFLGVRSDLEQILPGCDAFCLPSFYEAMPLSVLEAQACGLPCVTSVSVPAQADVTGTMTRLSLQAGLSVWADALVNAARQRDPQAISSQFIQSPMNIRHTADMLTHFYTRQLPADG